MSNPTRTVRLRQTRFRTTPQGEPGESTIGEITAEDPCDWDPELRRHPIYRDQYYQCRVIELPLPPDDEPAAATASPRAEPPPAKPGAEVHGEGLPVVQVDEQWLLRRYDSTLTMLKYHVPEERRLHQAGLLDVYNAGYHRGLAERTAETPQPDTELARLVEELDALAAKLTVGEWRDGFCHWGKSSVDAMLPTPIAGIESWTGSTINGHPCTQVAPPSLAPDDAAFIARVRNAWPALSATIRRAATVREERDKAAAAVEDANAWALNTARQHGWSGFSAEDAYEYIDTQLDQVDAERDALKKRLDEAEEEAALWRDMLAADGSWTRLTRAHLEKARELLARLQGGDGVQAWIRECDAYLRAPPPPTMPTAETKPDEKDPST